MWPLRLGHKSSAWSLRWSVRGESQLPRHEGTQAAAGEAYGTEASHQQPQEGSFLEADPPTHPAFTSSLMRDQAELPCEAAPKFPTPCEGVWHDADQEDTAGSLLGGFWETSVFGGQKGTQEGKQSLQAFWQWYMNM